MQSPSTLTITPSGQACGARITGLDLRAHLDEAMIAQIRAAWLIHHVLAFPDQVLSDNDLERFTAYFGPLGDNPFIAPIAGRKHIIAVKRAANETGPIFAERWHTDWSFQETPPAGTCLYSITIPPVGGDTLFANQHAALEAMPAPLRAKLEGKQAIHSARQAYAPNGTYGQQANATRSMEITPSPAAEAEYVHPLIRAHPETGRLGLFGAPGHITGFADMTDADSADLLGALYRWQTRPEFQYRHTWAPNMLVMWDNRSLIHMATGGYQGHERLLHRTIIGAL